MLAIITSFHNYDKISKPPTYGRICVPGLNLLHKFDATLQPGASGSQSTNVGNKRKTPEIPNVIKFTSASTTHLSKRILPTSLTNSSKTHATQFDSTLQPGANGSQSDIVGNKRKKPHIPNLVNFSSPSITHISKRILPTSLTNSSKTHATKFDATLQPGESGSQFDNVGIERNTLDIPHVMNFSSASSTHISKRILPKSLTKSSKTHVTLNKFSRLSQPQKLKSSTSIVGTIPKPAS